MKRLLVIYNVGGNDVSLGLAPTHVKNLETAYRTGNITLFKVEPQHISEDQVIVPYHSIHYAELVEYTDPETEKKVSEVIDKL